MEPVRLGGRGARAIIARYGDYARLFGDRAGEV